MESVLFRLERSARLWERYLAAGGSLAPEYDPMSEIYLAEGLYEKTAIFCDLVRENINCESLIEITRRCDWSCDLLETAQIGRGGGETFQMVFRGDGFVVIQPFEEIPVVSGQARA